MIVHGEKKTAQKLVAYVVPSTPGETLDSDAVLSKIKLKLPPYMMPAVVLSLDKFPLTSREKLDRKALPEPPSHVESKSSGPHVSSETDTEVAIEAVWREVASAIAIDPTLDSTLRLVLTMLGWEVLSYGDHELSVADDFVSVGGHFWDCFLGGLS